VSDIVSRRIFGTHGSFCQEEQLSRKAAGLLSFALLVACADAGTTELADPPDVNLAVGAAGHSMAAMKRMNTVPASEIARLRALLAPYHTLAKAQAGGWTTDITGCLELPGTGGMGHHYANLDWLSDSEVRWDRPELLVFAPSPNNRDGLKLVAAEYLVFQDLSPEAPVVFGQTMHENPDVGAWVLHVWFGANNPDGIFEDWNARVSC